MTLTARRKQALNGSAPSQTPSKQERIARRARRHGAWSVFISTLRTMSPTERIGEGVLMAIQAVCSASLAYGVGRLLHTQQAVWAAMTAIAVVQHSYVDTRHIARDQLIGALIGGLFGLVAALYGGGHYIVYVLAIAVAVIFCWTINSGSAARLSATTATIMLLVPTDGSPWDIALLRFGEVTLGTLSALSVCVVLSACEKWWTARHAQPTDTA
jgi:uncharacterized membrane protein YccC